MLSNVTSCRLNLDEESMSRLLPLAESAEAYWATRKGASMELIIRQERESSVGDPRRFARSIGRIDK